MPDIIDQIVAAIKEHNACLIYCQSFCPNCLEDNTTVGRFMILNSPWVVEGLNYDKVATLLCVFCTKDSNIEVNQEEILKNLKRFQLKGLLA